MDVLQVQLAANDKPAVDSIMNYEQNALSLSPGVDADTFYDRIRHTEYLVRMYLKMKMTKHY